MEPAPQTNRPGQTPAKSQRENPALRIILQGYPEATIAACAEYQRSGDDGALDLAIAGVVQHHLSKPPERPVAEMPGSTKLAGDLGMDSITMVEMACVFEDVVGTRLPDEELDKIVTLDDLRAVLRNLPSAQG
ncbi:MAG: phosphopantetheine-binding protein [Chthoniobacteraceae bacterium]